MVAPPTDTQPTNAGIEREGDRFGHLVAELAAVDPHVATRARPWREKWDSGLSVIHRSSRPTVRELPRYWRMARRQLHALVRAALIALFHGHIDTTPERVDLEFSHPMRLLRGPAPPPPGSGFTLAIITSPIAPAAPPHLLALV